MYSIKEYIIIVPSALLSTRIKHPKHIKYASPVKICDRAVHMGGYIDHTISSKLK